MNSNIDTLCSNSNSHRNVANRCKCCNGQARDEDGLIIVDSPIGVLAITNDELSTAKLRADSVLKSPDKRGRVEFVEKTPLLDAVEAAKLLGVDSTWLLARAREGGIPHYRLGKYVRFDLDEIRELFRQSIE